MDLRKLTTDGGQKYLHIIFAVFVTFVLCILAFFFIFRFHAVAVGLKKLLSVLMPFVFGAIIAYLLRPMCHFFQRKIAAKLGDRFTPKKTYTVSNAAAVAVSMILALLMVYLLLFVVLSSVIGTLAELATTFPDKMSEIALMVEAMAGDNEIVINYIQSIFKSFTEFVNNWLNGDLIPNLTSLLNGFSSGVMEIVNLVKNLFIGIIVAIYLLLGRRKFKMQLKLLLRAIFPANASNIVLKECRFADKVFSGFISGRILDSAIIGVICYVCLRILGMPDAVLISIIVGVTNIIPFFGPFIGAIPSAFIIFVSSPVKCVWFLIFIVILQQFDGNILGPKILGDRTGLPSFWVLFSILLFGGLFGFSGMLFGVPVFAVIYDICRQLLHWGLRRNGHGKLLDSYNKEKNS